MAEEMKTEAGSSNEETQQLEEKKKGSSSEAEHTEEKQKSDKIFTQEEVDRILKDRLARQNEKFKKLIEENGMTPAEEASKKLSDAEKRANDAERKLKISELAESKGVSKTLLEKSKLSGDELDEYAASLAEEFNQMKEKKEEDLKKKSQLVKKEINDKDDWSALDRLSIFSKS